MRGINPIILNSIFAFGIIGALIMMYLEISPLFGLVFIGIFILYGIVYTYFYIKIENLKKGRLIYKIHRGMKAIKYNSVIIFFLIIPTIFIRHFIALDYNYGIVLIALSNIIIWGYFLFGNYIFWTPTIKFYEKGIVFGNIAFYEWNELDVKEEGEEIKINIKYYSKEIVLNKDVLKGVNYERN